MVFLLPTTNGGTLSQSDSSHASQLQWRASNQQWTYLQTLFSTHLRIHTSANAGTLVCVRRSSVSVLSHDFYSRFLFPQNLIQDANMESIVLIEEDNSIQNKPL
eukprot:gb/GECG01003762.1/.p1 GENE.gb/GECG01003762.1/~~gb/GECG01003762.1/.p1  ORF type:complete len:104 (+),score=6.18 gb/GECG01003762.1/:1-312(+)